MVVVWHLTIWFCPPALLRHGYYAFLIVLVTCQYNRYLSVTTRIILYLQIIVVLLWHSVLAKSLNYKVSICFLPVTIRPGLSTTCTGVLKAVLSQVRMHQKLLTQLTTIFSMINCYLEVCQLQYSTFFLGGTNLNVYVWTGRGTTLSLCMILACLGRVEFLLPFYSPSI